MSAGKGDKQRPTDHKVYSDNYDKIFKKEITFKKFYADWCVPCTQLSLLLNNLNVQSIEEIDIDKDTEKQAKLYGIRSVPTMIKFINGSEVSRLHGNPGKKDVTDWLKSE